MRSASPCGAYEPPRSYSAASLEPRPAARTLSREPAGRHDGLLNEGRRAFAQLTADAFHEQEANARA